MKILVWTAAIATLLVLLLGGIALAQMAEAQEEYNGPSWKCMVHWQEEFQVPETVFPQLQGGIFTQETRTDICWSEYSGLRVRTTWRLWRELDGKKAPITKWATPPAAPRTLLPNTAKEPNWHELGGPNVKVFSEEGYNNPADTPDDSKLEEAKP